MAAVSARRMRGPSDTGVTKGRARSIARSSGAKPPSGPIRKARFELVVEKATELGVAASHPVVTRRSAVREA